MSILEWFSTTLANFFDWVYNQFAAIIAGIFDYFLALPQMLFSVVSGLLELIGFDFQSNSSLLSELWGLTAFIIPLDALLAIAVLNVTVILTIRTLRWTLAFVPTIGG